MPTPTPLAARREREQLRRRQGRSYARVGRLCLVSELTGVSKTQVHERANGNARFCMAELVECAKSTNPDVNPFHPLADGLAAVTGARLQLQPAQLAESALVRSPAEQKQQARADVLQLDLHHALRTVAERGIERLSWRERDQARGTIDRFRDELIRQIAAGLALASDLEALSTHFESRH